MKYKGYTKKEMRQYHKEYYNTLKGYLRNVYTHFNNRCNNPKDLRYKNYGGRGVENRFASFEVFYRYVVWGMGITTLETIRGFYIDRIDNNGHYECGNLRFVTCTESNKNRSKKYKQRFNYDL